VSWIGPCAFVNDFIPGLYDANVSAGNCKSPLTLSLSREGREDGAARDSFDCERRACNGGVPSPFAGEGGAHRAPGEGDDRRLP
jgi:hypothetical protein